MKLRLSSCLAASFLVVAAMLQASSHAQEIPVIVRAVDSAAAAGAIPRLWTQISSHSYEAEAPGFGTSKGYRSDVGAVTVYSYGLGITDWREGVTDPRVAAQMQEVVGAIREAERRGSYVNVALLPTTTITIAKLEFLFAEAELDIQNRRNWSGALLTVRNGKLLKYRMTTSAVSGAEAKSAMFQFVVASLASM